MKEYEVMSIQLSLRTGKIKLTPEQASAREHVLISLKGKDLYEITGDCNFKKGEVFFWDGEINKAQARDLAEVSKQTDPDDPNFELMKMSKAELQEIAGQLKLENFDSLIKVELIQIIKEAGKKS